MPSTARGPFLKSLTRPSTTIPLFRAATLQRYRASDALRLRRVLRGSRVAARARFIRAGGAPRRRRCSRAWEGAHGEPAVPPCSLCSQLRGAPREVRLAAGELILHLLHVRRDVLLLAHQLGLACGERFLAV